MSGQPLADFFQPGYGQDGQRAAIEAAFPGWEVSRSALDRWYASRRTPLSLPGGQQYRPTLGADDAAGLRAAIVSFGA